jgi:prepilin-type N-terminal cleavage/methylation domain-containing protein
LNPALLFLRRLVAPGPGSQPNRGGFTLLEVLIAMVILSLAVVSMVQLSAQGLRLVKLSGDHQEATRLADRIARGTEIRGEAVDGGEEGPFTWERRIALVLVPKELSTATGPAPQLYSLSVNVRWGGGRSVELATLRTLAGPPERPGS